MRKKRVMVCVLIACLFLWATPARATAFSTADLEGQWRGYWLETTASNSFRYWIQVSAVIDADGNTSGTWQSSGGKSGNINGGSLSVSPQGALSGTFEIIDSATAETDTISVMYGWMDTAKEMVYVTMKKPAAGQLSAGMLTKYTYSNFATADLEGFWKTMEVESEPSSTPEAWWVDSTLTVGNAGETVGVWNFADEESGSFLSSTLALNTYGVISGSLIPQVGQLVTIDGGQLDLQLNCGSFASTKSTGELGGGVFLRIGETGFLTSDLEGKWAIYRTKVYSSTTMTWLAGEVTFDEAGNLVSGTWAGPGGESGTYTGGAMSVGDTGDMNGNFTTSLGYTFTISGGHMGIPKTYAGMVARYKTYGESGYTLEQVFMIKKTALTCLAPLYLLLD